MDEIISFENLRGNGHLGVGHGLPSFGTLAKSPITFEHAQTSNATLDGHVMTFVHVDTP